MAIPYEELSDERQGIPENYYFRKNCGKIPMILQPEFLLFQTLRAEAIASNSKFYGGLFTNDPALADLRNAYSIPENSLKDPATSSTCLTASFSGYPGLVSLNVPDSQLHIPTTGLLKNLLETDQQDHCFYGQDSVSLFFLQELVLMVWYYARRRDEEADTIPANISLVKRNTDSFAESYCKIFLDCISTSSCSGNNGSYYCTLWC